MVSRVKQNVKRNFDILKLFVFFISASNYSSVNGKLRQKEPAPLINVTAALWFWGNQPPRATLLKQSPVPTSKAPNVPVT